jgi:hypothetical protein
MKIAQIEIASGILTERLGMSVDLTKFRPTYSRVSLTWRTAKYQVNFIRYRPGEV